MWICKSPEWCWCNVARPYGHIPEREDVHASGKRRNRCRRAKRGQRREEAKHRTRGQPNLTHGCRTHYSGPRFIPATYMSGRSLMKYCIHREDVLGEHVLGYGSSRSRVCMHVGSLFADLCLMQIRFAGRKCILMSKNQELISLFT